MEIYCVIVTSIVFLLIGLLIVLEKEYQSTSSKLELAQKKANEFEHKFLEEKKLYLTEKEDHYSDVATLMKTRLTPEASAKIERNLNELQDEYVKIVKRNEHLEGMLKNSDLLLDRYREYCGDVLILGLEYKPSKTPICTPEFIKEENPDG